jgi:hypothetical protein
MKLLALTAFAAMSVGLLGACDRQPERPGQPDLQASFNKADANRDGVIEQSEATSIANQNFGEVDTDDNQAVSIDEFEVALKNAPPPRG